MTSLLTALKKNGVSSIVTRTKESEDPEPNPLASFSPLSLLPLVQGEQSQIQNGYGAQRTFRWFGMGTKDISEIFVQNGYPLRYTQSGKNNVPSFPSMSALQAQRAHTPTLYNDEAIKVFFECVYGNNKQLINVGHFVSLVRSSNFNVVRSGSGNLVTSSVHTDENNVSNNANHSGNGSSTSGNGNMSHRRARRTTSKNMRLTTITCFLPASFLLRLFTLDQIEEYKDVVAAYLNLLKYNLAIDSDTSYPAQILNVHGYMDVMGTGRSLLLCVEVEVFIKPSMWRSMSSSAFNAGVPLLFRYKKNGIFMDVNDPRKELFMSWTAPIPAALRELMWVSHRMKSGDENLSDTTDSIHKYLIDHLAEVLDMDTIELRERAEKLISAANFDVVSQQVNLSILLYMFYYLDDLEEDQKENLLYGSNRSEKDKAFLRDENGKVNMPFSLNTLSVVTSRGFGKSLVTMTSLAMHMQDHPEKYRKVLFVCGNGGTKSMLIALRAMKMNVSVYVQRHGKIVQSTIDEEEENIEMARDGQFEEVDNYCESDNELTECDIDLTAESGPRKRQKRKEENFSKASINALNDLLGDDSESDSEPDTDDNEDDSEEQNDTIEIMDEDSDYSEDSAEEDDDDDDDDIVDVSGGCFVVLSIEDMTQVDVTRNFLSERGEDWTLVVDNHRPPLGSGYVFLGPACKHQIILQTPFTESEQPRLLKSLLLLEDSVDKVLQIPTALKHERTIEMKRLKVGDRFGPEEHPLYRAIVKIVQYFALQGNDDASKYVWLAQTLESLVSGEKVPKRLSNRVIKECNDLKDSMELSEITISDALGALNRLQNDGLQTAECPICSTTKKSEDFVYSSCDHAWCKSCHANMRVHLPKGGTLSCPSCRSDIGRVSIIEKKKTGKKRKRGSDDEEDGGELLDDTFDTYSGKISSLVSYFVREAREARRMKKAKKGKVNEVKGSGVIEEPEVGKVWSIVHRDQVTLDTLARYLDRRLHKYGAEVVPFAKKDSDLETQAKYDAVMHHAHRGKLVVVLIPFGLCKTMSCRLLTRVYLTSLPDRNIFQWKQAMSMGNDPLGKNKNPLEVFTVTSDDEHALFKMYCNRWADLESEEIMYKGLLSQWLANLVQ